MKDYNEIIEDQNKLGQKYRDEQSDKSEKLADRKWFNKVLGIFLNSIKQFTYSVKVTNEKDLEPAIKKVEKAVREIPETEVIDPRPEIAKLLKAVQSLNLAVNIPETKIPDNKKELVSIEKAVKGIKIPEVKIPAQKEIDFSSVINALQDLKKSIVVPDIKNDIKTQDSLNAVLVNLESGLKNVEARLVEVRDKEIPVQVDNSKSIIAGLKDIKAAIKGLRFPVATFNSQPIVDAINAMTVSVDTTGLATETKQDALLTELQKKADLTETQPVSATSLPLPTGAATEATLDAIATSLNDGSQLVQIVDGGQNVVSLATENTLQEISNNTGETVTTLQAIGIGFSADADITTTINGDIITQTDGVKTLTTTISGNTITEEWS